MTSTKKFGVDDTKELSVFHGDTLTVECWDLHEARNIAMASDLNSVLNAIHDLNAVHFGLGKIDEFGEILAPALTESQVDERCAALVTAISMFSKRLYATIRTYEPEGYYQDDGK